MKRPRVMQLVVGGDVGGAERLLVDLAGRPEESCAEHEVALFTPNSVLSALFIEAGLVVHDRGRVRENPLAYLYRSLGPVDVAWLTALLRERRIDILHTHTLGSHVLGTRAARRAKCRQLRTEHHVMHYADPSASPFTRWAAARTDRLVAVSEYVRAAVTKTAPSLVERMRVIRNGIDPHRFAPDSGAAPRPRPSEAFSAAIVGRLTAWKRVELAITACALAEVELVVVGDGEERPRLEALARAQRAPVRFVGYQQDPRPFFAGCDVTLNTSKAEALPLSVLESLAMERPVIACAAGGIPEIVQHDQTGWLVEGEGARAIADALLRAKSRRAELGDMGARGRRFVLQEASTSLMCGGYAETYEELSRLP
jgi:glycosyltransferase involved in cell wall biosynthesis